MTGVDEEHSEAEAVEDDRAEPAGRGRSRFRKILSGAAELPVLVLLAFGIAIVVKTFFVQAFYIPSGSMLPTLQVGDRVLVEKVTYFFGDPSVQDVVVFERDVFGEPPDVPWPQDVVNFVRELLGLPTGRAEDYIKRIVGTGGDTIRYAGRPRRLVVNGRRVEEPYLRGRDRSSPALTGGDCRALDMDRVGNACRVPAGHVFVMGDNRTNSEDSRALGPIERDKIVGHAFVIMWPPRDVGGL